MDRPHVPTPRAVFVNCPCHSSLHYSPILTTSIVVPSPRVTRRSPLASSLFVLDKALSHRLNSFYGNLVSPVRVPSFDEPRLRCLFVDSYISSPLGSPRTILTCSASLRFVAAFSISFPDATSPCLTISPLSPYPTGSFMGTSPSYI